MASVIKTIEGGGERQIRVEYPNLSPQEPQPDGRTPGVSGAATLRAAALRLHVRKVGVPASLPRQELVQPPISDSVMRTGVMLTTENDECELISDSEDEAG